MGVGSNPFASLDKVSSACVIQPHMCSCTTAGLAAVHAPAMLMLVVPTTPPDWFASHALCQRNLALRSWR